MTFCEHRVDIMLQILEPRNQRRSILRMIQLYLKTKKKPNGEVKLSYKEEEELRRLIDIQTTFFKEMNNVLIGQYEKLDIDTILSELHT